MRVPISILSNLPKCAARDNSRYALAGVCFERTEAPHRYLAVATDSKKLVAVEFQSPTNGLCPAALIPSKAINDIAKSARSARVPDVSIVDKDGASGVAAEALIGSDEFGERRAFRLEEGRYPKWEDILPNYRTPVARGSANEGLSVKVNAADFIDAIQTVAKSTNSDVVWLELCMDPRRVMRVCSPISLDGTQAMAAVAPLFTENEVNPLYTGYWLGPNRKPIESPKESTEETPEKAQDSPTEAPTESENSSDDDATIDVDLDAMDRSDVAIEVAPTGCESPADSPEIPEETTCDVANSSEESPVIPEETTYDDEAQPVDDGRWVDYATVPPIPGDSVLASILAAYGD